MKKPSLSYKQLDENGNIRSISLALLARCREFMNNPTEAERILWEHLRNRKLGRFKFLRQHPIGGYIADFYCHNKQLAIELDGDIHRRKDIKAKDKLRQKFLEKTGLDSCV